MRTFRSIVFLSFVFPSFFLMAGLAYGLPAPGAGHGDGHAGQAQDAGQAPQNGIQSPSRFLGYAPGERFTRHHDILAYFRHVADASPHVHLKEYGESYRFRPLIAVFVSSEENLHGLDTIRVNNRRMAGLDPGEVEGRTAAILWMSYGIHGNESSSPEAAMWTLYALAAGMEDSLGTGMESGMDTDRETALDGGLESGMVAGRETALGPDMASASDIQKWLENTVVVIDPVLNPDGRERYVQWFDQTQGRHPDPRLETREHAEPWPGARSNHYYFDLNRDWAWQTQIESKQRAALYHLWMPHVHADFHEMFTNDYYFPPAAEPFHTAITPWQREFQHKIGQNHASRFDRRHERYFTAEIFDLFYPGFGDTWPTFNGAIGMTYEQMGHSRAGNKMIDEHGDTLTLAERIRNHHEVGLSTVEVTAQNSERLLHEFREYFRRAQQDPDGRFSAFVISGENHPDRLITFLDYLDRQEIRYHLAEGGRRFTGRHYASGEEQRRRTADTDIVVPVRQPKAVLTHVLFDPDPAVVLADSNTYDITAWAIPYAYGLEAWATADQIRLSDEPVRTSTSYRPLFPSTDSEPDHTSDNRHSAYGTDDNNAARTSNEPGQSHTSVDREPSGDQGYAWLLAWGDVRDAAFVAGLLSRDVRMSITERPFTIAGRSWPSGSVVITRRANRHLGDRLPRIIDNVAARHDRRVQPVSTGLTDYGVDLGSPHVRPLEKPVVAVPSGDGIASGNLGEIRHFFDYTLEYPLAVFDQRRFSRFPLEDYNVLLLPEGSYTDWRESDWDRIMEWVRKGGRLIAFPTVLRTLSAREDVPLTMRSFDAPGDSDVDPAASGAGSAASTKGVYDDPDSTFPTSDTRFENRRLQALNRQISGAVLRVELDDSHPLAYGIGPAYATLKRGAVLPELLTDGWNVARIAAEDPILGGWAGQEAQQLAAGSLMAGTISSGRGQIVILADNPLYRGFWRNGQLLFSNAIFQAWIAQ
ncbi:MAG: zinc carboxypeptidase [Balneolaceae bacterium]|nr:MAG: zinc carboxypeptidase [Balneolaceae bacterium]